MIFSKKGLVIDIGSGAEPYPAADVLVDMYDEPTERAGKLIKDRPFVYANAQALPFADHAFSLCISRQCLEHVERPDFMLNELSRIGSQVFIQTPNALSEILEGWHFHKWIIHIREGILEIRKNNVPQSIKDFVEYLGIPNTPEYRHFQYLNQERFTISFKCSGKIPYRILPTFDWFSGNVKELCDKPPLPNARASVYSRLRFFLPARVLKPFRFLRSKMMNWMHGYYRRDIDIESILRCPLCLNKLKFKDDSAICHKCDRIFYKREGFYDFIVEVGKEPNLLKRFNADLEPDL